MILDFIIMVRLLITIALISLIILQLINYYKSVKITRKIRRYISTIRQPNKMTYPVILHSRKEFEKEGSKRKGIYGLLFFDKKSIVVLGNELQFPLMLKNKIGSVEEIVFREGRMNYRWVGINVMKGFTSWIFIEDDEKSFYFTVDPIGSLYNEYKQNKNLFHLLTMYNKNPIKYKKEEETRVDDLKDEEPIGVKLILKSPALWLVLIVAFIFSMPLIVLTISSVNLVWIILGTIITLILIGSIMYYLPRKEQEQ